MRKTYVIKEILHSGRKGVRNEPVNSPKYIGLIGARCFTDLDQIKQYQPMHFDIPSGEINCPYDWWDTSEVLEVSVDNENKKVYIETANTIYTLQEV